MLSNIGPKRYYFGQKEAKMNKFLARRALFCIPLFFSSTGFVAGSSRDVSWTFGSFGTQSYSLDGFGPGGADLGASIGALDRTLTLHMGWRYQVTVTNFLTHPFEGLAKGDCKQSGVQKSGLPYRFARKLSRKREILIV